MINKNTTILFGILLAVMFFLAAYTIYKNKKIGKRWSGRIIKLNKRQARNKTLEAMIIGIILLVSTLIIFLFSK